MCSASVRDHSFVQGMAPNALAAAITRVGAVPANCVALQGWAAGVHDLHNLTKVRKQGFPLRDVVIYGLPKSAERSSPRPHLKRF